jgi:hypothetical protein
VTRTPLRWAALPHLCFVLSTAVAILGASSNQAVAHERRLVGPYELTVGWRDEPAVVNASNAVSVEIREAASGDAVDGIHGLTAEVTYGGLQRAATLPLEPVGSAHPGTYTGALTPTRSGDYLFRIRGQVGAQAVDERFESGPGRFDPVKASNAVTYPDSAGSEGVIEDLRRVQVVAFAALALSILSGAGLILAVARNRRAR